MEKITVGGREVGYIVNKDCWEVVSHKSDSGGYPMVKIQGWSYRIHRLLYMEKVLRVKELSSDIYILHSCDNRKCINPDHLRAGTALENMQDRLSRSGYKDVNKGEEVSLSKFTEEQVREIRRLKGTYTQRELARIYNTTDATISYIVRRLTWKHI